MSERTLCNHCSLVRMRRKATQRGTTVVLGRDEHGWITATYADRDEPSASFMALTEHCVC